MGIDLVVLTKVDQLTVSQAHVRNEENMSSIWKHGIDHIKIPVKWDEGLKCGGNLTPSFMVQ